MDFYSPLIPPGGFKAEPNGERSLREELFEARLGIATSNSMCLSLGKGSWKSGRFFSADGGDNDSTGAASDRVYVQCDAM